MILTCLGIMLLIYAISLYRRPQKCTYDIDALCLESGKNPKVEFDLGGQDIIQQINCRPQKQFTNIPVEIDEQGNAQAKRLIHPRAHACTLAIFATLVIIMSFENDGYGLQLP